MWPTNRWDYEITSRIAELYSRVYYLWCNSEDAQETDDKKRDWKDDKEMEVAIKTEEGEKTDADTSMDKSTADEAKDANTSATDKDAKTTGKKSEARHAESRYAEVPMNHMFCHICNKHMWDGYVRIDAIVDIYTIL